VNDTATAIVASAGTFAQGGRTKREIADHLGLGYSTVAKYVNNLVYGGHLEALGVTPGGADLFCQARPDVEEEAFTK
jgi:predicted transcriptional regulator